MSGELGIRIAIGQFNELTEEKLIYAQQLGVPGVQMNTPKLPDHGGFWAYEDILALREKTEEYGLRFEAIENVPIHFYDKAMLGLPGRDEQIENYRTTIRNVGGRGSRSSATISCRTRSGAPRAPRPDAAARTSPRSTWPSSRRRRAAGRAPSSPSATRRWTHSG
jgi:hypothetical protein